ncbi:MAG: hypothetical protein IKX40_05060 [Thermoguttaceae bacterium]|nr:hypothetical protein [Thermoguttaceae bacterium]
MNELQKLEIQRTVDEAPEGESVTFYQPPQKSQAAALTELEISKCFQKIEVKGKFHFVTGLTNWGKILLEKLEQWEQDNAAKEELNIKNLFQ